MTKKYRQRKLCVHSALRIEIDTVLSVLLHELGRHTHAAISTVLTSKTIITDGDLGHPAHRGQLKKTIANRSAISGIQGGVCDSLR